ncbi:MAG: ATP-binding protein [Alphaproteobacteria bacterium]
MTSVLDAEAPAAGTGAVLVMASVDDDHLGRLMRQPFAAYLEAPEPGEDHQVTAGPRFESTVAAGGLYFWLTTGTAFQLATTMLFCDGLVTRGAVTGEQREGVELALHEAVANALLHGNLGLDSEMRDDFRRYAEFCQLLDERLRDPVRHRQRVEIAATWQPGFLEIVVTDQGEGYADAAITPDEPEETANGLLIHGLGIIHALTESVTTDADGRGLILRFAT